MASQIQFNNANAQNRKIISIHLINRSVGRTRARMVSSLLKYENAKNRNVIHLHPSVRACCARIPFASSVHSKFCGNIIIIIIRLEHLVALQIVDINCSVSAAHLRSVMPIELLARGARTITIAFHSRIYLSNYVKTPAHHMWANIRAFSRLFTCRIQIQPTHTHIRTHSIDGISIYFASTSRLIFHFFSREHTCDFILLSIFFLLFKLCFVCFHFVTFIVSMVASASKSHEMRKTFVEASVAAHLVFVFTMKSH